MDANRFDSLPRLVLTSSRRETVRLLLGSVLGGLLLLGTVSTEAKKQRGKDPKKGGTGANPKHGAVRDERCLTIGEKCPKRLRHGKKKRKHSCEQGCCTRYAEVGGDGTRRCACKPNGVPCSPETARQCCSQVCTSGVCGGVAPPPPPACDVCPSGCAFSSVQAAVDAASPGTTIRICPGTYVGDLVITKNVTLIGTGDAADPTTNTILQGTGSGRVVDILGRIEVTLRNVRITGGSAGFGAGITNEQGTLTLIDSTVTGNTASQLGGGIYNESGTLTLTNSEVAGNSAAVAAGGIYNGTGTVTIDAASRVTGNTAPEGGGIYNNFGTVTLASNQIVTNNCRYNCAGTTPVPNCAVTPVSCP